MSTATQDRAFRRIVAMIAQSEDASNEEGAQTFAEAAQRLAQQYAIDMAVARAALAKSNQPPTPIIETVATGKRGSRGLSNYVDLITGIARANGLKLDISHYKDYVVLYGFDDQIEVVKAMFIRLAPTMSRLAYDHVKSTDDWKREGMTALAARLSFQKAFADQVSYRLAVAARESREEAIATEKKANEAANATHQTSTSVEVALTERSAEVASFHRSNSKARGTYKSSSSIRRRGSSYFAGSEAGRKVSLSDASALGGAKAAINA